MPKLMLPSFTPSVAIIIPIDFRRRCSQIKHRLKELAGSVVGTEFFLIVAYSHDKESEKWLKDGENTWGRGVLETVPVFGTSSMPELARLRNEAVKKTDAEYILLLDVDILADIDTFRELVKDAKQGDGFSMAPCFYLTNSGNGRIKKYGKKIIIKEYLNFSFDSVMHVARPSSVVSMKREDYWAAGGFCEKYNGHGYEDFDFLIRMAIYKNRPLNYNVIDVDETYRSPLLSIGFRAELAKLCVNNLLDGNIVFHLYHDKNKRDFYYKKRENNKLIFKNRIDAFKEISLNDEFDISLVEYFIKFCKEKNKNYIDYSSLFDARPRHHLVKINFLKRIFKVSILPYLSATLAPTQK